MTVDINKGQSAVEPAVGKDQSRRLLLVGNPNVGKSVLFGLFSGQYAMVSNYPGTTVELTRSHARIEGRRYELIDTPGANNLLPNSEDEQVTARLVLSSPGAVVVQVADAKNISRALMLTVQLSELGVPMVLDLNMWDEAQDLRISIDHERLAEQIGAPVIRCTRPSNDSFGNLQQTVSPPFASLRSPGAAVCSTPSAPYHISYGVRPVCTLRAGNLPRTCQKPAGNACS